MKSRSTIWLAVMAAAVMVAGLAAGCRQTRPIPAYEPLLALEANSARASASSPAEEMYRPSWSGPKPAPRKGG
jgi:hypothetical protein